MNKYYKKTLGLLSLTIITMIMTIFAARLPTPIARADTTLVVEVLDTSPNIQFPNDGKTVHDSEQNITYNPARLTNIGVRLIHTNLDNKEKTYNLEEDEISVMPAGVINLGPNLTKYGHGKYVVTIFGINKGNPVSETFTFHYLPKKIIEVPATGLFSGNLTKGDQLTVGSTVIVAICLGCFFMIKLRQDKRSKKPQKSQNPRRAKKTPKPQTKKTRQTPKPQTKKTRQTPKPRH